MLKIHVSVAGMFGPKGNRTEARVSAGLMFPGLELQVYKVSS